MSDASQGPGWWIASDGKWYPPHLHPSLQPSPSWAPGWSATGPTPTGTTQDIHVQGTKGRRRTVVIGTIGSVVLLIVGLIVGVDLARGSRTNGTSATANLGTVVFSDNFSDPLSGWFNASTRGVSYSYSHGMYVIVPTGNIHWFSPAPFTQPVQAMSVAVTATESASAPLGAGFGVVCTRGSGTAQTRFEFLELVSGLWFIEENTGVPSVSRPAHILKQGIAPTPLGTTETTIEGACVSQSAGRTTHLDMFIDGTSVADLDAVTPLPGSGWLSAIVADSRESGRSTVSVRHFEERDISG